MKLEGIAAFLAIVEAGSVSGAGRELNLSKSVVSERLSELERSLGAHLVQRTTRKLSITAEGSAFLERARRILQEAADARSEIAERRGELVGPLRISAPVSFGTLHLGRALHPFLLANPGIQLTLDLDDRFVDVAAEMQLSERDAAGASASDSMSERRASTRPSTSFAACGPALSVARNRAALAVMQPTFSSCPTISSTWSSGTSRSV